MLSIYLSAFLLGFYGSGHCAAMCGPVLSIIGVNTQLNMRRPQLSAALFYNLGRLTTYVLLGIVIGLINLAFVDIKPIQLGLRYFSALMMLLIALQLLGLPSALAPIEKIGQLIWKPISKYSKAFFPITSVQGALFTGMIWGFLPCGMVYAALTQSFAGAHVLDSGLIMLCFGLGTLPSMLSFSIFGNYLGAFLRHKNARRLAGVLIIVMSVFYLLSTGGGKQHAPVDAPHSAISAPLHTRTPDQLAPSAN